MQETNIITKAYKCRIYPNKKQCTQLAKTFGCVRFVYNYYLGKRIEFYENEHKTLTYNACAKDLTELKNTLNWLKEVDSTSLQSSLKNLDIAYKNFFKGDAGFPKFKRKRDNHKSYTTKFTNNNIEFLGNYIKIPKLGTVKTKTTLKPEGKILSVTISKEPSGKYYASIACEDVVVDKFTKTGNLIGIDLGIKSFCILSDSTIFENPKYLKKSLDNIKKAQKELSRKQKGSSNYKK